MIGYAELELGLQRRDVDSYAVQLRFSQPDMDEDLLLAQYDTAVVRLDVNMLRQMDPTSDTYSEQLSKQLFADASVREGFLKAYTIAQSLDLPLRLRLLLNPSATKLHYLHWETLRHPRDQSSLLTSEHVLFSRYVAVQDLRSARSRPKGDLRALVIIANPSELATLRHQPGGRVLTPLDVPRELAQAKAGLDTIPITALASGGTATLNNLLEHLRDGYDILYLVCHGALIDDEPWLWMENESGSIARVAGTELVARIKELQQRPKLVVLASCQSAGNSDEPRSDDAGALSAVGPSLAEAGIPAVVAMQGSVTMRTVAEFMPVFFQELQRDGQIDRAMAVARGVVRERPDSWMPVLFMRLKSGRIWYVPGATRDQPEFEKWPALLSDIRRQRCTAIIGPSMLDALLGSTRQIAQHWAEQYHFPMDPHDRDDLPLVAQYLTVMQGFRFPYETALPDYLSQALVQRFGPDLPQELRTTTPDQLLDLMSAVGAQRRARNPTEPHMVLAQLPISIYITTNPDNLLAEALQATGKRPEVEICPWNEYVEQSQSVYDDEPDYQPTPERPLVYHLFGHFRAPDSLVLTEDDYFDYLIGVTTNKDLIPEAVRGALANSALLFVGFQLEDWSFRVLFRSLMQQEGRNRRKRYNHIAAQIDPDDTRTYEPGRARRYLESYFQGAAVSIYWGNTDDFMRELATRWQTLAGKTMAPLERVA